MRTWSGVLAVNHAGVRRKRRASAPRVAAGAWGVSGWAVRHLPNYTSLKRRDERIAMAWAAALMVLLGLDATSRRSALVDRLFAGPGLALASVALTGPLIDIWALRTPRSRIVRVDGEVTISISSAWPYQPQSR